MTTPIKPRSDATKGKKKKKAKKTIIENIPDIPGHNVEDHIVPYAITDAEAAGVEGTSVCPIYVSDYEDTSEVAIRGDRKIDKDLEKLNGFNKKWKTDLPRTTNSNKETTEQLTRKSLVGVEEVLQPEIKKKKKRNLKKSITKLSNKSHKKPLRIDVTAIGDEEHDPILERELEEIALNGRRSGLISGTPEKAAYDIENGKPKGWRKQSKKLQAEKQDLMDPEDDMDKSWLKGTLTKEDDIKKQISRQRMIYAGTLLVAAVTVIVLVSFGVMKRKNPSKPLTPEQQVLHDVLARVTGEKTLRDAGTSQNLGRNWLLFDDEEVWKLESQKDIFQRFALATFYFATGGVEWYENNWLTGPVCGDDKSEAWLGIDCDKNGNIRAIALDAMNLAGTIPQEVGHLYKLENLIVKNNPDLKGWIPASFSHLEKLRQLGLYNNNLSGVLPNIFEHTTALKYINVENNSIHGSIPPEVSNLKSLETLVLKNNQFEGIVPFKQLASTGVKYLGLSENKFGGRIENAIHGLETLEYLYLDNNKMRGTIPPHIGNLINLKSMDLGNNEFVGLLPMSLGNLVKLEYLSLNDNKFRGNLPRRVSLLTNLKTLNTASNTFTGTVPDLSAMVHLKSLQLYENEFKGSIPDSLEHLQSIETLVLSSNRFTGTIPETLSRMGRTLTGLYLSDNLLEGNIPTHLCEFVGLEALFLDTNKLIGSIPPCFGDLYDLKQLYLYKNKLTGSIPSNIQNLKHLTDFGVESNYFVGHVPEEVCGLVQKQQVEMWADCDMSGKNLQCPCCSVCCPGDNCF